MSVAVSEIVVSNCIVHPSTSFGSGSSIVTSGPLVSILITLVSLCPTLFASSAHFIFQLYAPSAKAEDVNVVNVLFATVLLDALVTPSKYNVQDIDVSKLSAAVNVKSGVLSVVL